MSGGAFLKTKVTTQSVRRNDVFFNAFYLKESLNNFLSHGFDSANAESALILLGV